MITAIADNRVERFAARLRERLGLSDEYRALSDEQCVLNVALVALRDDLGGRGSPKRRAGRPLAGSGEAS